LDDKTYWEYVQLEGYLEDTIRQDMIDDGYSDREIFERVTRIFSNPSLFADYIGRYGSEGHISEIEPKKVLQNIKKYIARRDDR